MQKTILRILLITAEMAACYPLAALFAFWNETVNTGISLAFTVGIMVSCWIGALLYLMLAARLKKTTARVVIVGVMVVLFALCFLIPLRTMWLRGIYGVGVAAACYGGTVLIFQPLPKLVHRDKLTILMAADVLLGIVCGLVDDNIAITPILIVLMANTLLFALTYHELSLEEMLTDRGDHVWHLPKEIRSRSTILMIVFCALGCIFLCLVPLLTKALRWMIHWIGQGVSALLSLAFSGRGNTTQPAVEEASTEEMVPTEPATSASWIWTVLEIAAVVAIVALIVWKRRQIFAWLQEKWQAFRLWLKNRRKKSATAEEEKYAYRDFTEDVLVQEQISGKSEKLTRSERHWRREYRRYQRMPIGAARFRLGYALLLAALPEDRVKPSDSTGDILARQDDNQNWVDVTKTYDAVRYGERTPQRDDFDALDTLLRAT